LSRFLIAILLAGAISQPLVYAEEGKWGWLKGWGKQIDKDKAAAPVTPPPVVGARGLSDERQAKDVLKVDTEAPAEMSCGGEKPACKATEETSSTPLSAR